MQESPQLASGAGLRGAQGRPGRAGQAEPAPRDRAPPALVFLSVQGDCWTGSGFMISSPARHPHLWAPTLPSPRSHASCSSGLYRNLGPLVSNRLTPHFLSLRRLLLGLIRSPAWTCRKPCLGLEPLPMVQLTAASSHLILCHLRHTTQDT